MRIKKTSQTTSTQAQVVDGYSTSTTDSYSCNYVNNNSQDIYSTNETKTNKRWINGKPIYRKVITGTLSDGDPQHNLTNFEIVSMVGKLKNTSTGNFFLIPSLRPTYPNYEIGMYVTPTNVMFDYGSSINASLVEYTVCLEYIKTTD